MCHFLSFKSFVLNAVRMFVMCYSIIIITGYSATIRSNSTAGAAVIRVSAFDMDGVGNVQKNSQNSLLSYSILSDKDEVLNTFNMDNSTGKITLIRDLVRNGESLTFSTNLEILEKNKCTNNG